jgi:hypothetical protein
MSGINNPGTQQVTSVFGRTGAIVAASDDYLLVRGRQTLISCDGTSTTINAQGDVATLTGSSLAESPTSIAGAALGIFASNTNTASGLNGNLNYRTGRNIRFFLLCGAAGKITDERWWWGVTDQTLATMSGSANPAGNYAAFRFDTTASDTTWQCITKDGSTQNVQASGVAPVINTVQTFAIEFNDSGSTVLFYINGSLVATSSSHLPSASTNLRYVLTTECFSSTTSNGFTFEQLFISSDI